MPCPEGYACTDLGATENGDYSKGERCLATCVRDTDGDALSRCETGMCKLSATGLTTVSADGSR